MGEQETPMKQKVIDDMNSAPLLTLKIPRVGSDENSPFALQLKAGDRVFLLGGNGTGKSSLLHFLACNAGDNIIRVAAHRQMGTESGRVGMTAAQRQTYEDRLRYNDRNEESLYFERQSQQRIQALIFDLVNEQARMNQEAVDQGLINLDSKQFKQARPVDRLNCLLTTAQIKITVKIDGVRAVQAERGDGIPFDFAKASDGERAAIFLITTVLIAPPDSIILIDEPERHLNHAIIAPLLRDLFAERSDCAMVVSTHAIDLAAEHTEAQMLLVRDIHRSSSGQPADSWDFDHLKAGSDIPEDVRCNILGARRRILFVEGTNASLDEGLYTTLLPDLSIIPKGTARDVIDATKGVNNTRNQHHTEAFGLIDHDGRSVSDVEGLSKEHIYVLDLNAIEAIYYHPEVINEVSKVQADTLGGNTSDYYQQTISAAIKELKQNRDHLCAKAVEIHVRKQFQQEIPTSKDIQNKKQCAVSIDFGPLLSTEQEHFDRAVAESDLVTLLQRYKLRECGARKKIGEILKFSHYKDYEAAVRKRVRTDKELQKKLRKLLGGLPEKLGIP